MSATIQADTGKWLRVPLEEVASAQKLGPLMVYRDHWWVIDGSGNALFFKSLNHPQCNAHESIVRRLMVGRDHGGCDVAFLPWAYLRFSISDYA